MTGWRPALRLAWRDALRARGRSILVLVMIALPVLAVTAAAVVQATSDVDGVDAISRTMGAAEARIHPMGGTVVQAPDPDSGMFTSRGGGEAPTLPALSEELGDREVVTIAEGYADVPLGERRLDTQVTEVDLRNPLTEGLFDLRTGALPATPGEVVINDAFAERGVAIGDTLDVLGQDVTVVGIGRDATFRDELTVAGPSGSFGPDFTGDGTAPDWLVGGDPLLWSDVLAINKQGGLVHSRAVLHDPPPVLEMAEEMGYDTGYGDYVAIVSLIVAMALLEVVLLAGPAFAVSARRQARTLALMAASGGTPRQARRVVLASGVVLGAVAALIGAVCGVLLGLALLPVVQRFSNVWFGPIDVNWLVVAIVAAFGLLSALLAAVAPAWLASRQDVVAVLAGRRGDAPPSARTPIVGLVLLGAGIALSVFGVRGGEFAIALGAIVAVFGMIFIVPLVVAVVARMSGRLPLVMRYAARDAARHRTRTVPAIAAVAATVAGVVALGIANTSDEAENRQTYTPELPMGAGIVNIYTTSDRDGTTILPTEQDWTEVEALVRSRVDDLEVVRGAGQEAADGSFLSLDFRAPGGEPTLLDGWGGRLNTGLVVADSLPRFVDLDDAQRATAQRALTAGRAVVFTSRPVDGDEVRVRTHQWDPATETSEPGRLDWPAVFVQVREGYPVAQAIAPPTLAADLGVEIRTAGLYLGDPGLSESAETELNEELHGINKVAQLYLERGYQAPDEIFILLLILFTLGGVLMLGGTLTATFLALSDARPDLATLSAVGAAPRSRRGVAASYALVVGFVGAVLGALVGFIPGVAITYPLTSTAQGACVASDNGPLVCDNGGPYLDIPWLMILGLVIALPLLTALIVGLSARSRLPLAARLT